MAEVQKTVKVKTTESCPYCDGTGWNQEAGKGLDGFKRCEVCRGDREFKSTQTKTVTIEE